MTVEENWIDALEKMQVSKLVKNYIVSIDEELRECFQSKLSKINKRVKSEIYDSLYVSNVSGMINILNKEMNDFVDSVTSLIDYYSDGIFNCGKVFSRNKLRLEKQKSTDGSKYFFNEKDRMFLEHYKSKKIYEISSFMNSLITQEINKFVNSKLNGQWNLDDDNDFQKINYKKQTLNDEDFSDIENIIIKSMNPIYDEILDFIMREVIVLYQVAQMHEYKNLSIDTFTIYVEDDEQCCSICSVKSGKIFHMSNLLDGAYDLIEGHQHAFCKYSIEPVISYRNQITTLYFESAFSIRPDSISYGDSDISGLEKIEKRLNIDVDGISFKSIPIEMEKRTKNLLLKLKTKFPKLIKKHTFIFHDDISNTKDWFESVKTHYVNKNNSDFSSENMALKDQDILTNQIATFNFKDKIYISALSFDSQPIEHLILREMLRGRVIITEEIKNIYQEKQKTKKVAHGVAIYKDPFVSFLSEDSEEEYLLELIVFYVIQPNKLRFVDPKGFNYIEKNLFNVVGDNKDEV